MNETSPEDVIREVLNHPQAYLHPDPIPGQSMALPALDTLVAERDRLKAALGEIASGGMTTSGGHYTEVEMQHIARRALEEEE